MTQTSKSLLKGILLAGTAWLVGMFLVITIPQNQVPPEIAALFVHPVPEGALWVEHFFYILKHNLIIAILIFTLGFLSGGLLTIGCFLFNGLLMGFALRESDGFAAFHMPIEMFGLLLLGALSFNGLSLIRAFASQREVPISAYLPGWKQLALSFGLLCIAALVEAFTLFAATN